MKFKNLSIKIKLVLLFIILKVIPLLILLYIGIESFYKIETSLNKNTDKIIKDTQKSMQNTTDLAIKDSISALDKKSKTMLENQTVMIAKEVAKFLKQRDSDILLLSNSTISQKTLELFYKLKNSEINIPTKYIYDNTKDTWKIVSTTHNTKSQQKIKILDDNKKEFHKVTKVNPRRKLIPIYKEITFYNLTGKEIYKVSSINTNKLDISKKENTYLKAEEYYQKSKNLKKGEIYVSNVIGRYIPSKIIGLYNKKRAEKIGIRFDPKNSAYAGFENPAGKQYQGIIRFVTPVYKNSKKIGYITLALDHRHIMNFTDYVEPFKNEPKLISDASKGNYAFMWDNHFLCISHPRDYFIMGYDKNGKLVPGWVSVSLWEKYKKSGIKNLLKFLKTIPPFYKQSFKKKPNPYQIKIGTIGLDCKYLNFAPQCHGWKVLTDDGGYGSFVIFWSGIWKLTTAATIPYYTGQYGKNKRGFGFVTIGSNVKDFHKSATLSKKKIAKIFNSEKIKIKDQIIDILNFVKQNIFEQMKKMSISTLLLIMIVIYVAILLANYISKRLNYILYGISQIKQNNYGYNIKVDSNDEIGKVSQAFNEMSDSINSLNKKLLQKIYIDELTGLKNRNGFLKDIKNIKECIVYLCDIDHFKHINDYYGIEAGNFVLQKFAKVLASYSKTNKMHVYRLGSDEFLLVQQKKYNKKIVISTANSLFYLISKTRYKKSSLSLNITIDITCGIAYGSENLLEEADMALNEACKKNKDFIIFDPNNTNVLKQNEYILWRKKLQNAIKSNNIVPFYQPIINISNGNIEKYECLIRIIDTDKVISPYLFLTVAKEAKLYPLLTKIMIEKTFKYFSNSNIYFSLNISEYDISNESTINYLKKMIKKYSIGNRLTLELLESEEIQDLDNLFVFISDMRKFGVKFAIDDFGSGYSNFAYLKKIKPEYIKIDGSLIQNIHEDQDSYEIVKTIVKFSTTLGAKTIAEFVHNKEVYDMTKNLGIDYAQGYYIDEPIRDIRGI